MCEHHLGTLPCINPDPEHDGGDHGRDCIHDGGSGVKSLRHEDDGGN